MSTPSATIPEWEVPEQLGYLINSCEKNCVAECCGLDAFDFSPLHIASYVTAHTGNISEKELASWSQIIDEFEANFETLSSGEEDGLVCVITSMNQFFTEKASRALLSELRTSLLAAPKVLEFSNSIKIPDQAWKVMQDYNVVELPKLP